MKRKLTAGLTSASLPIFVQDSTSTTGAGLAITFASSGLIFEYRRQGQSTWTSVTPVTKTLGTYVSGGIVADGSLTGAYEIDPPDAALATGARWVAIRLRGVANMFPVLIEIELDAVNYQDAVGFGLSRLDQNIGSRMATYTQPTGFLASTFPTNLASEATLITVASYVDTEVAAIKAKTDLLPTFPSNFASLAVDVNGKVLLQPTQTGVTIPTVTTVSNAVTLPTIPTDWITANGVATDAIGTLELAAGAASEIATAVRTELTTELGRMDATVSSRSTSAQVNAEMLDVLNVDTFAELTSPPAATSSLREKLTWLFMWARNKSTQSATQRKLYADDGSTVVSTEVVSDDATTYTKGEAS